MAFQFVNLKGSRKSSLKKEGAFIHIPAVNQGAKSPCSSLTFSAEVSKLMKAGNWEFVSYGDDPERGLYYLVSDVDDSDRTVRAVSYRSTTDCATVSFKALIDLIRKATHIPTAAIDIKVSFLRGFAPSPKGQAIMFSIKELIR